MKALRESYQFVTHLRRAKNLNGFRRSMVVQRCEQNLLLTRQQVACGPRVLRRHFATGLGGGRESGVEVKEKIQGVEEERNEVKKKIQGVERKIDGVEKKIEGIEALSWDKLSAAKQMTLQDEVGFEKWKMAEKNKLQEKENKLQDILKGLQEKENILLKQAGSIDVDKKAVDSPARVLDVLQTLFPEYPQPRTTTERCASISEVVLNTPLLARDDQLTQLYSLWKDRMSSPDVCKPERMGHPIVALSCLPGGGKTTFLSHALKRPTFVDKLAENDPTTWGPFAKRFRNSIRLFVTFNGGADVLPEEKKLGGHERLALRILYAYWFGTGDHKEFPTFARKWLDAAKAPDLSVILDLIKEVSGDVDVFLAVDELLRAHRNSEEPASQFNENFLSSIGGLLSNRGPRFHAVVSSLERKSFNDLLTSSGRPVKFVDISSLNRDDSRTLVQNLLDRVHVDWPKDSVATRYIEFAIGASLGHPRTLQFIAEMIRVNKSVTATNVLGVLGEHFEITPLLAHCKNDHQLAALLKLVVRAAALGVEPKVEDGLVCVADDLKLPEDDFIRYGALMDPVRSLQDSELTQFSPGFFIRCMKRLKNSTIEEYRDLADALRQIFDPKILERQATDRGYIFEGFHLGFMALQSWALGDGTRSLRDVFQNVKRFKKPGYAKELELLEKTQFINKTPMKIVNIGRNGFVTEGKKVFQDMGKNLVLYHEPMESAADMSFWSNQPSGKMLVVAYECKYRIMKDHSGPADIELEKKMDAMRAQTFGMEDIDFVHIFPVRNTMTNKTHMISSNSATIPTMALDQDDLAHLYKNMNMSPILLLKHPDKKEPKPAEVG